MQPARGRFARFDLDRQIASTFPAHWKVGPAPVFWASQPLEPSEWLTLLILKAGDVENKVLHVVVVVVDPTPPTCCQQSPAPEIMWQPAVSPPRWQGKAPLCRDSSRGPG